MASTPNTHQTEVLDSGKPFRRAGRRNLSFSSSSSSHSSFGSLSFIEDFNSFSPITPLGFSSGVPFSWEKIPGIPKQDSTKNKDSLKDLLPLPPARKASNSTKKYGYQQFKKKDPFFAAFVECSKDDEDDDDDALGSLWRGSRITKALSCKRSCSVSDSLVYTPIPRSSSDLSAAQSSFKLSLQSSLRKSSCRQGFFNR